MPEAPDTFTLDRHRDLVGREPRPVIRWAVLETSGELSFIQK